MVVNQLVRRHVDLLRTFLLEKIELREPETDESFKALVNSLGLSLDRRAGLGLGEIHRDWNLGLFTDFSPYLDIDQRITARGSADEALYYPNLFANAQAELENKLTEDDYRIEFHAYQAELREAGGYEKLAYPREKFMLRIMNRASPELERIRQERLERQNAIRNTFPSSWNKTPIELTRETGLNISEQDIQIAKTNAVREWFSGKKLGSPSDEQATVIANCHNSLKVVARAGSGKTKTIAQKIPFFNSLS
jgi:hypothetical protein